MGRQPCLCIVDDQFDGTAAALYDEWRQRGHVRPILRHPNDVTKDDIFDADLVLVDFRIDEAWPEREDASGRIAVSPPDGVALLSILRRHALEETDPPTGFAIFTGKIDELASPLPVETAPHLLARLVAAEWVFSKSSSSLVDDAESLCIAISLLPQNWDEDGLQELDRLLSLSSIATESPALYEQLRSDVLECLPPLHALYAWSHGLSLVRWLLHRIFPYPCFLASTAQLAVMLGLQPKDMASHLKNAAFVEFIEPARYSGILAGFGPPRWWRRAVEDRLWAAIGPNALRGNEVQKFLMAKFNLQIPNTDPVIDAVLCLGPDLRPTGDVVSANECVRIRPDDWPAYAKPAWVRIQDAKSHPRLASLVHPDDSHRV